MNDEEDRQEIIIVKRIVDGDGGHHGGAWKIAFADFMTAMMALFLVLWLVSAANEKTKKSVASYFNPVKLVDRTRSSKGLSQSSDSENKTAADKSQDSVSSPAESKIESMNEDSVDEALFNDPFTVLEGIAQTELERIERSDNALDQAFVAGSPTEDAFLDPFAQIIAGAEDGDIDVPAPGDKKPSETKPASVMVDPSKLDRPLIEETSKPGKIDAESPRIKVAELAPESTAVEQTEAQENLQNLSAELMEDIKKRLGEKLGLNEKISESLSIEVTKDGILISITDQFGFSMFRVGSAVPKGEMVVAMKEISDILGKRQGMVRDYGHTDGRAYSNGEYDNWRLSTSRAHSARLMLARGGLGNKRISQVVGFADRKLKLSDQPEAEANRRIEILLEVL